MDKSVKIFSAFIGLSLALSGCQTNSETPVDATSELQGFSLANLDTTVSPCQDFFKYASGGWSKLNPIPETESRWGNFGILQEKNQLKIQGLLDSLSSVTGFTAETRYAKLLSIQYQAGLDTAAINLGGAAPLNAYRAQLQTIQSLNDYPNLLTYSLKNGFGAPISLNVGADSKNSNAYLLTLGAGSLGLPDRDYYLKSDTASVKLQDQYKAHIATMFGFLEMQENQAKAAAQAVFDFEKSLAQNMLSRTERREPENTYNKMSLSQAQAMATGIDLASLFGALNITVDSLNVSQLVYWEQLTNLLTTVDFVTLKQYHLWQVVRGSAGYLSANFEQESFNFYQKTLRGVNSMKPRWRRVIGSLGNGLSEPLGRLFAQRYFPPQSKAAVELMVEDLRIAYRKRINSLTWMGDSTKTRALEKLASFKYKIGYPSQWKDLSALSLKPNQYYKNHLALRVFGVAENFAKLGKPVDKNEWFMPAYLVNAYYSPSYNEIVFPAGILQPPFYGSGADEAINYGGIGGVIGHEFSHGFDDQGSKYDGYGNLNEWWTTQDRANFEGRTQVMVNQYNNYEPIPHLHVNGEMTLGENIADLGGLTMAYYGYQERLARLGLSPQVKSGFSWQQRIFLGWAQVWQTNQKDEYTKNQVVTDYHSPAQYRVNGPVSNMPEFWEAWGCQLGEELVRTDSLQVEIW